MLHRIFNNKTVSSNQRTDYSDWVQLPDNYSFHAINGYYTVGNGYITIYYQIAAREDASYVDEDVKIQLHPVERSGLMIFHEPVAVLPNEHIRFFAVEESGVADVSGLTMQFIQKGRVG